MTHDEVLLEIMEKTISTLESNKNIILSIIKNLQSEHEKKKTELLDIKNQLPKIFTYVKQLRVLDHKLRHELALASNDFSPHGHENLKRLFDQANVVHTQLLIGEESEKTSIKRRDELELDLKNSEFNIKQAECMAQQLFVSLSYLQTGTAQLNTSLEEKEATLSDTSLLHYLAFFKSLENEKLRIARDLHDGPIQHIASVQMRIDFCKTAIMQDLEKGLHILDQLKGDLSDTLSEVRDILFDLNPAPLEKIGLKGSIEHLLYSILDPEKIHIIFSYTLDTSSITMPLQTTIYRIIQELVTNIKKHANATSITLRISQARHFIYIHLEDNGIGFNVPSDLESLRIQAKSYGLINVTTRISELNGTLKINSKKHQGSLFIIQLPILSI